MKHVRAPQRTTPTSDVLIFAVTYNEALTINELLDALIALPLRADLLVVDDLGTDATSDILRQRALQEPRLDYIVRPGKLGIGSAHKMGWEYARRLGYSRVVSLDADMSHDPNDIPRLLAALDAGADIAIGSRFLPNSKLDYRGFRLFLSRNANRFARFLTRLPISEFTTSLRAARLSAVPQKLIETIEEDGYSFFFTCMARFGRHNLRIAEIPIHFRDRQAGTSKISKQEILRSGCNLLRLTFQRSDKSNSPMTLNRSARSLSPNSPECGQLD